MTGGRHRHPQDKGKGGKTKIILIIVFLLIATAASVFAAGRAGRQPVAVEASDIPPKTQSAAPQETAAETDPSAYTIETARFDISTEGTNARETTDGINEALQWAKQQGYKSVVFPKGTYLIQCAWNNRFIAPTDGILPPSGMKLLLGQAVFKIEPNSYPAYCIFGVVDQSDVTITGGTLIGDRDAHTFAPSKDSATHEWGFGIITSASTNVTIQGVTIRDMTGDGIILEGSYKALADGGRVSSGIKIYDCDISNCRRQGVSVIGSPGSEIARNRICDIQGTDPQYGIDVETEFDYNVDGLKIYDNIIYNCAGGAISCNKGANYEVYGNTCVGGNIIAVQSSNVKIYGNTVKKSFIRVYAGAKDIAVQDNQLDAYSEIMIDEK